MTDLRKLVPVLAAALLTVLAGCGGHGTPPPLFYGHVAGLHEPAGASQRGIRLAVVEADKDPEQGAGRPVAVLHAEANGKLETLEAEAVRLAAVNRVQALLGGTTAVELERLDRARSVVVSPCGLRPPALSDNVFCTGLSPPFRGQVLARYAREELKAGKVAVLVDERAAEYRELADAFARAWAGTKDAPPLTTLRYGKDVKFEELAGRLVGDWPEAVLFAGTAEDLRAWRRALDKLPPAPEGRKMSAVLFGGDDGSLAALRGERETRSGVHVPTAFVKEGGTPRMREFAAKYLETFQEEPDAPAALAYDNARLLFAAQKRALESGKTLREELAATTDFAGLSGPLKFEADQCVRRPAFVVRLDDGQVKFVKRYDPPAN